MREVLWDSLVEGLQSGKCVLVLVLGPDIPALRRSGGAAAARQARPAMRRKTAPEMRSATSSLPK